MKTARGLWLNGSAFVVCMVAACLFISTHPVLAIVEIGIAAMNCSIFFINLREALR